MSNSALKLKAQATPLNSAALKFEALPPAYFFAPDLEREINRLESVTAAKVLSIGSEIDEIHALEPPQKNRSRHRILAPGAIWDSH